MSDPGEYGDPPEIAEDTAGFRRTPRGVSARFTAAEAGIVRSLVGQIAELVGGPGAAEAPAGAEEVPGTPSQAADGPLMDLAAILDDGGPAAPPQDPVLARLLPDAYGDDPAAAGEFRRYTEQGLRSGKVAAARTVLATLPGDGGLVRLSAGDAEAWLRSLNDVRLAMGVVLGITEDYEREFSEVDPHDLRQAYLYAYDFLTFLQETLVHALN